MRTFSIKSSRQKDILSNTNRVTCLRFSFCAQFINHCLNCFSLCLCVMLNCKSFMHHRPSNHQFSDLQTTRNHRFSFAAGQDRKAWKRGALKEWRGSVCRVHYAAEPSEWWCGPVILKHRKSSEMETLFIIEYFSRFFFPSAVRAAYLHFVILQLLSGRWTNL